MRLSLHPGVALPPVVVSAPVLEAAVVVPITVSRAANLGVCFLYTTCLNIGAATPSAGKQGLGASASERGSRWRR